jgi:hypothetical protein
MNYLNIKETFLTLTSETYPNGTEDDAIRYLPNNIQKDMVGNYFLKIGNSETVFSCHLDTACKYKSNIKHKIDDHIIKTDGTTILGADDKAGMCILLYMIEKNIPGLYYFFIGEEVGCIGSKNISKNILLFNKYQRIISFDRRGETSVITHQSRKRTCSDAFADSLIHEYQKSGLILEKDQNGIYTDSAEFIDIIPECTNISVGYMYEHTNNEQQNIFYLEKLAVASVMVNWECLLTERKAGDYEYKQSSYYYDCNSDNFYYNKNADKNPRKENREYKKKEKRNRKKNKPLLLDYKKDCFLGIKEFYLNDNITKEDFYSLKDNYLDPFDEADNKFINQMELKFLRKKLNYVL